MPPMIGMAAASAIGGIANAVGGSSGGSGGGGASGGGGSGGGVGPLAGGIATSLNPSTSYGLGQNNPASNSGLSAMYLPTGGASIDQLIQQLLGSQGGLASGAGSNTAPNLSALWTGGTNSAMNSLSALGGQNVGNATTMSGAVAPALQQVINSAGFNPGALSALYNQLMTNTTNQANVQNSQSGVGGTPYGAGVANEDVQNFQMQWPLFLQSLQTGGEQNLQGLGSFATTGANLGQLGATQQSASQTLPYTTYDQLAGLSQGLNASGITGGQGYLTGATNASTGANAASLAQAQLVGNQNANAAAAINNGLSGFFGPNGVGSSLGSLYNSIFGGGGGASGTSTGGVADYTTAGPGADVTYSDPSMGAFNVGYTGDGSP
jgi:hypothetical protein